MLPVKRLVIFVLVSTVIYGILVVPKTPLMDGYRAAMRAISSAIFYKLGNGGSASLEKLSDSQHDKDTIVRLVNRNQRKPNGDYASGWFDMKLLLKGYRPTCFLVALVIATPVGWRRKLWALFFGLVLVTVFVVFRIWLDVVNGMSNNDAVSVYTLSPFSKRALIFLVKTLTENAIAGYVVPALIWALVTLRKSDLVRLAEPATGSVENSSAHHAKTAHAS